MARNNVIGKDNQMPWHLSEDLRRFKQLTLNHPVIMGRKTFESLGKPLPKRLNIVVTRNAEYRAEGVTVVGSLDDAIELACRSDSEEIFIAGGAQIYAQALKRVDRMYLTTINKEFEGDTSFPAFSDEDFKLIEEESHKGELEYQFLTYERHTN